jgi:hypothetical protein
MTAEGTVLLVEWSLAQAVMSLAAARRSLPTGQVPAARRRRRPRVKSPPVIG